MKINKGSCGDNYGEFLGTITGRMCIAILGEVHGAIPATVSKGTIRIFLQIFFRKFLWQFLQWTPLEVPAEVAFGIPPRITARDFSKSSSKSSLADFSPKVLLWILQGFLKNFSKNWIFEVFLQKFKFSQECRLKFLQEYLIWFYPLTIYSRIPLE